MATLLRGKDLSNQTIRVNGSLYLNDTDVTNLTSEISSVDARVTNLQSQVDTLNTSSLSDWPSGVSSTEVGYLDGVNSNIQEQIDNNIGKKLPIYVIWCPPGETNFEIVILKTGDGIENLRVGQYIKVSGLTEVGVPDAQLNTIHELTHAEFIPAGEGPAVYFLQVTIATAPTQEVYETYPEGATVEFIPSLQGLYDWPVTELQELTLTEAQTIEDGSMKVPTCDDVYHFLTDFYNTALVPDGKNASFYANSEIRWYQGVPVESPVTMRLSPYGTQMFDLSCTNLSASTLTVGGLDVVNEINATKDSLTERIRSDVSGISGSPGTISNIVSLTQAEYDAIGTPDANTIFLIVT